MADPQRADPADGMITELARAKVNLTLRVLGRRSDGYHALESLVVFADVADVVTLTAGEQPGVTTTGRFASDIAGENLAAEALRQLSEAEPRLRLGAVTIEKNLPVAAGLGGGSADAAATLRAVRRANAAFADSFGWHGFATRLGADVPVCLANTPAIMWGIGERLRPVDGLPVLPAVLVTPDAPVPANKTRDVFRRLAAPALVQGAGLTDPPPPPQFSDPEDFITYLETFANDLAGPARELMPACRDAEAALAACDGCRLVRMSGAGPTTFGLFASSESARAAALHLAHAHPGWWVKAVTLG